MLKSMVSFTAALRQIMKKFAVASTPRTQAEIQWVTSGFAAAEWGQPITNSAITTAEVKFITMRL